MNNKYFAIILSILVLLCASPAMAALGVGTWLSNNGQSLTITNGQSAEFTYGITAVTQFGGSFSIKLYDSNNNVVTSYFSDKPTVNNGALGTITVTPSNYGNLPGNYYVLITAKDKFGSDSYTIDLKVNPVVVIPELSVSCAATPTSGDKPLSVSFTSSVSGGNGVYTYNWAFGDGGSSNVAGNTNHVYTNSGSYHPQLTVSDTSGKTKIVQCSGPIVVKEPQPSLSASCSVSPTSGVAPLLVTLNGAANGGSGIYTYEFTFGDGSSTTISSTPDKNVQRTHTYSHGTFKPTLKVTDSQNHVVTTACTDNTGIVVTQPVTPKLKIDNINCFPRITDGANQSCSVAVSANDVTIAGNVNVKIYYLDGTLFGTCTTDRLSGGCEVENEVHGVGTYTVYATATKSGYIGDTDTYPRYSFDVYAQRYNVINLETYKDKDFKYPEDTFYRGQALYAKFQVYDPVNNKFVNNDIVTAASLVSMPGGRVDLSKLRYNNNWYYYELKAIPLTHDFLGGSNVFAFAFNFTGMTSGQAQVEITILNNLPTIASIPDVYVKVDSTQYIDLDNYGFDLEDHTLRYEITEFMSGYNAQLSNRATLSITGVTPGDYTLTIKGYDLDDDFATRKINIHVLPVVIPPAELKVSCAATPLSGDKPLNVAFTSSVSGGTGPYTYTWSFGDNSISNDAVSTSHTYNIEGTYNSKLTVKDAAGKTASANCGNIVVKTPAPKPPLNASCTANPTTGLKPLNVAFNSQVTGGAGGYTYLWTFADGSTSTNPVSASHIYTNAGFYKPKLTVTDCEGNTITVDCPKINVTEPGTPQPNLTVSCTAIPTDGYAPLTVQLKASANGGSGTYNYNFTLGNGHTAIVPGTTSHNVQVSETYDVGTYYPSVTVKDSNGKTATAKCTDNSGIKVSTPKLKIENINCFPRVRDGANQSCSVKLSSSNGQIPGDVNVDIYYTSGAKFGTCKTDKLSGACEVENIVNGVGTYTVYAIATKNGYVADNDKNPTYTFDVYAQRYNIINLGTYKDKNFHYPEDTFYRGQALYVKFQVYDPINNKFMTDDIVTASSLVSLPGGRVDLSKMTYSGNWYYYELKQIPLTHDFLGGSNVFAFAFNFTGQVSGEAQVALTILNNNPTIKPIPDVYVDVGSTQYLELDNYGTDLEDPQLSWHLQNLSTGYAATISNRDTLAITGITPGDYTLRVVGYDLDGASVGGNIIIHVIPGTVPSVFTATCKAMPLNGTTPFNVTLLVSTQNGTGPYTYTFDYDGMGTVVKNTNIDVHTYVSEGVYTPSVKVVDAAGKIAYAECGKVVAKHPIVVPPVNNITVSCSATPQSGDKPLNVAFTSSVSGGNGQYSYSWAFGDGGSSNAAVNTNHVYTNAGTYHAQLTVTDSTGRSGMANCGGTITVNNPLPPTNFTLDADAGGPYTGFVHEPVVFYGGSSTPRDKIVLYRWDFGDGTIRDTNFHDIIYTYNKIGRYNVKLTVFDAAGRSDVAYTTATIVERTRNSTRQPIEDLPDKGLLVSNLLVYGEKGEIISPNDDMTVSMNVKNMWNRKLENVRVVVSLPEYGLESRSTTFDLSKGETENIAIVMPLYDLDPGMHYVRISITNDDDGDRVKRIKYREIIVRD